MDRVRVDFRNNELVNSAGNAGGFDASGGANAGSITITETDPGVGIYAANWPDIADAYGQENLTASTDNVYCYIYLILDAAPSASQTVLQMLDTADAVIGEINVETDRTLLLKNNDSTIGSASSALTLGTLYRIGLTYKKGTGSDAELYGYLATKHQDFGAAFASSTSESNTTAIDHIRVGACDAVSFDGRVGLLAGRNDVMPGSWLDVHDLVIGTLGLVRAENTPIAETDLTPSQSRAAVGESRFDAFQMPSLRSQTNWGGGAGQLRDEAQDKFLTGIGDGRFVGNFFPPRAKQDEASTGGTTDLWYFRRGTNLYGFQAGGTIELVGSSTTYTNTSGIPRHRPVGDADQNVYWATTSDTVKKFAAAATTDVTPTQITRAEHVTRYGRHIWCIGEYDIPSLTHNYDGNQSYTAIGNSRTVTFSTTPIQAETTLSIVVFFLDDASIGTLTLTTDSEDDGWAFLGADEETAGTDDDIRCEIFYHWGGGATAKSMTVTSSNATMDYMVHRHYVTGADPDGALGVTFATDAGTATSLSTTGGTAGDGQLAGIAVNNTETFSPASGWVEEAEEQVGSGMDTAIVSKTSGDTTHNWTGLTSADNKIVFNISIDETPDAGMTQLIVAATGNQGMSWAAAPANFTMNIFGTIRASVALDGSLWIVTDEGLFKMRATVDLTNAGNEIVTVTIDGPEDQWDLPADDNAGNWIASFQGLLYYPVGGTIRRYAPSSSDPNDDRQFWPTPEWSTVAGKVQALISNESGIWFGSAGYLWLFNGRGFQQMASEPSANDFDYMMFHQGKLYLNTDPADYFEFDYPSSRPDYLLDTGDLAAADFATGYMITSAWDFGKVVDPKVITTFELITSFTGGDANSGTVAIDYREGCDATNDPGVGGGGDTGAVWINVGTQSWVSGKGHERFVVTTPIKCMMPFFRLTLTPGSSGIPVVHAFTVYGNTVMPRFRAVGGQFLARTGLRDKENNTIFDTPAQATKLVQVLKAMRKVDGANPLDDDMHWNLYYKDGTDGGDEYVVTFGQLSNSERAWKENDKVAEFLIEPQFWEVPS